jgi:hypothetical protein|tara:strand:+ start:1498 stop:2844 length:1347 start_codon:yes stop_codon:yes gene_type:complete
MSNDNNYKEIYSSLGLRNISDKEFNRLHTNIRQYYSINEFTFYTPLIKLFTNYINTTKSLNTKHKLFQLIKKKKRFGSIGFSYKAKIKTDSNKIIHKDVFVKEVPFLDPTNMDIYYQNISSPHSDISPVGQAVYNSLYNLTNNTHVELFVTYLVSKLVELNISPTFSMFYGNYYTNMSKFSYDITSSEDILDKLDEIMNIDEPVNYYSTEDDILLEYSNVPAYLIVTEYSKLGIDYLLETKKITYDIIRSAMFQIVSAIVTMRSVFGIKHNDLHFGNIMIEPTTKQFLYYQFNKIYYKIPTYGYIFKIIDWGRATYLFNDLMGDNSVFNGPGECFEQYVYKRANNSGLAPLDVNENDWTDIIMFCHSMLYEYKDTLANTDLARLLKKQITSTDKELIEIRQFDWELYTEISEKSFNIQPSGIFTNRIFNDFKIKKPKNIDQVVYKILL